MAWASPLCRSIIRKLIQPVCVAGPEKKGAVVTERKRKLVAYHEAGHALVGALMPEYDPVTKISIVPRGAAGGLTFFAPSEERLESGLYSRTYFENQVCGRSLLICVWRNLLSCIKLTAGMLPTMPASLMQVMSQWFM